ncbi:branched-chain alpha-keto acid dehydrogenase subunit E2 [Anaerobacillus alkalidiazotrophicus]|uniref:Dihydrolipoamide acetyltransferase component of pyruvate dehydrogenase complex n=1 Tax=Anaerobacillus alkalidiazotrophicus TaxID=472963 RepID=A0A1S2M6K9_9BACI|nr:dihydrolipoamide acetyltransferase family protein [Anaerobacillus alkalidiazotrophicus]OIJ20331.1 branched-chain alpha-keto acid dehydrogenase subunit E2 [Anaerobacillus alkalidiazotrophicus]
MREVYKVISEIKMPQLGESVTEGTISKWLVKKGDKVNKYDPLAEVMTDKVNAEIPSTFSGTIKELIAKEDETIEVGGVICTIEGDKVVETISKTTSIDKKTNLDRTNTSEKRRYSPAVLRLASEHNIDLLSVTGTGRGGRITRKDIQTIIENGDLSHVEITEPVQEKITSNEINDEKLDIQPWATTVVGDIEIPVTGVRKAIAANMVKSKNEAPHAWTMVEVDVTNLVNFRNEIKESFKQKEGYNLTYLPFFIKVVVEALKEFPQLNSLWGGDKIIQKKDVNIAIAVATDDALYVPVIKHADEKSIKGLAGEINALASKVRNKAVTSNDMQGGTFTINNTGSFGSILSAPIINHPQAAILSIEAIVKRPVILHNDAIAIRHMVNLCLSLDHRVLDGLICGRFLARVKEKLEKLSKENIKVY